MTCDQCEYERERDIVQRASSRRNSASRNNFLERHDITLVTDKQSDYHSNACSYHHPALAQYIAR